MTRVWLGVGSNRQRYTHVARALDALDAEFGELVLSPVYESEAVGFAGDPFLNLVVGIDTGRDLPWLVRYLKALEDANGCDRSAGKFSGRTLDVDILTFGDLCGCHHGVTLPRAEVLSNAFVLRPLADVAGSEHHPQLGRTYADLWREYRSPQRLWPVTFHWRGRDLLRGAK